MKEVDKMKFTFKTKHSTGQYRAFFPNNHHIKLNKKQIGSIDDKFPHKIRLMIKKEDIMEDGNPNCSWKWITLKKESISVQEAKDFLQTNIEKICEQYILHQLEN